VFSLLLFLLFIIIILVVVVIILVVVVIIKGDLNPESENCSVQKSPPCQIDFGNYDRCKREYRQYRYCRHQSWEVGCECHSDRTAAIGVAGLGERRRLAGTPPAGHSLQHRLHYFPTT
jgi:hypothetical protein